MLSVWFQMMPYGHHVIIYLFICSIRSQTNIGTHTWGTVMEFNPMRKTSSQHRIFIHTHTVHVYAVASLHTFVHVHVHLFRGRVCGWDGCIQFQTGF